MSDERWEHDLVAWARARTAGEELPFPRPPRAVLPRTDEEIRAEIDSGESPPPTRFEELAAFASFVRGESHALPTFAGLPGYLTQQAYNAARSGPVADRADARLDRGAVPWGLLRGPAWRPPYVPRPAAVRILEGDFYDVAVTPDGGTACAADFDGTLWLWDLATGVSLRRLPPPEGGTRLERVAITPDARWAAAGDSRGVLRLWDLGHERSGAELEAHGREVQSVQLAPDAAWVLTAGADDAVRLWDPRRRACTRELVAAGVRHAVASADARVLALGFEDGTIRVVDPAGSGRGTTLLGHRKAVTALAMTPDGRRLVSGSEDGTVRVWEPGAGRTIHVLEAEARESDGSDVSAVDVTPDGRLAISGGLDALVRLWDVEAGRCLKIFWSHTDTIIAVAISADGTRAVSSTACDDPTIRVWDPGGYDPPRAHGYQGNMWDVALSADARVAATLNGAIRVWDVAERRDRKVAEAPRRWSDSVALTPDGRFVVNTDGGRVVVRDAADGETVAGLAYESPTDDLTLAMSPDGRCVLVAPSYGAGPLVTWDLATGERKTLHVFESTFGSSHPRSLAVSRDGRIGIVREGPEGLAAWRLDTSRPVWTLPGDPFWSADDGRPLRIARESFRSTPTALPGERIAVDADGQVLRLVELDTGRVVAAVDVLSTLFGDAIACRTVAVGDRFGTLHVFEVRAAEPGVPSVTIVRPYRLDLGRWEDDPTAVCAACRATIAPTGPVLASIASWQETLPAEGVPCLDLPDDAFADPRLAVSCPHCDAPLRFDPYVVDGRDEGSRP